MILLHIALANLRYRLHLLADRIYDVTHEPIDLGDNDPDVQFFHAAVLAKRADDARGIRHVNGGIRDGSGRFATLSEVAA